MASDESLIDVAEPEALRREIERLRAELAKCEGQLGQAQKLAYRDPLVDLPNRRSFLASIESLIARVKRYGGPAAMLFADVDGLKAVNDKFGHTAGDKALIEVAQLLKASVRKHDCVARIGGDEFGILLENTDELSARRMAVRVTEAVVGSQFCVDGFCLPLSIAVGVGVIEPRDTAEQLIERADKEMYQVKAENRSAT